MKAWIRPYRRASGFVFQPKAIEQIQQGVETTPASRSLITRNLEDAYAWRLFRAGRDAGVELPKNILRHTAITMRVNLTHDVREVSRWAGNSPDIISAHYLGTATPHDARSFYALLPEIPDESVAGVDGLAIASPVLEEHAAAV